MNRLSRTDLIVAAAMLTLAWGCKRQTGNPGGNPAPDGRNHGHEHGQAPAGVTELEPVSVTLFTPKVELFMEYPRLVVGETATFITHLTVLATGEPVRSGRLTLTAAATDGSRVEAGVPGPKRDGLFTPELKFGRAGTYKSRIAIASPQIDESIELELVVYPDLHEAQHAAERESQEEPADTVPFLMEQQWKLAMRLAQAEKRTLVERLQIPGQIEAPSGHSALAGAPVAGRLVRSADAPWPKIGDRVEAGQVLALVEPALPATEAAQLSANLAQFQALEVELLLRGTEVEKTLAQAKTRLGFAQRAFDRAMELKQKGVGTDQQFDEAEQGFELAKIEFGAAEQMKTQYELARQRIVELRSQAFGGDPAPQANLQLPVRAPIDGQIVSIVHIEGEHVDAHQEIFRIVNLEHVWVVGQISEFDLHRLPGEPTANMTVASEPERHHDLLAAGGRLVHVGTVIDPQSRTVPVRYEVPNRDGRLRAGLFVDLFLETRRSLDAVAIPQECIVLESGQPIAFVCLEGELFQKRELELGVRDAGWVEVKCGLEAGERLAARGAYAIHLASQSPSTFGHGHAH
ncbi:MAG: efflux RND transporter periplasmic adaptor subunit [Phycisphaerales bacterium]|nr:MAG: efflux RND transporter periplasmic adaptor subunit [Phycisphaerales bacterium]